MSTYDEHTVETTHQTTQPAKPVASPPWLAILTNIMTSVHATYLWLLLILLVGAILRFQGLNWDENQHLHPDERFLTMVAAGMQWPEDYKQYFDPMNSPLSPYSQGEHIHYVYGTLPLLIVKKISLLLDKSTYDQVHLVGRALSSLFDLGSIFFLFLIGRRLYNDKVALLGAAFLSLSVLPIQLSHFFAVDTFANFFVMLTVYWALRASETGEWLDYALTGISLGAGMASKISVLTLGVVIVIIVGLDVYRLIKKNNTPAQRIFEHSIVRLLTIIVFMFFTFRILQPIAFEGPKFTNFSLNKVWLDDMKEMSELVKGIRDIPPFIQWADRPDLVFPWQNMVLWGMGIPLGLAAWAGWLLGAYELIRKRNLQHLIPVVYIGVTFFYHGTQWVKYMRYFMPIYPFLALMAGYLLYWVWKQATQQQVPDSSTDDTISPPTKRLMAKLATPPVALALAVVVLGGTLFYALAFTAIYRNTHPRVEASRWLFENVPAGTTIANEHWDDTLPLNVDGKIGFGDKYINVSMPNYEAESPQKLEQMIDFMSQADYLILASNRLYDSIPRLPQRYPMTIRYYDLLFAEQLGFRKVNEYTSYPRLFSITIPDQSAEEAFSVYDHPKVTIFEKTDEFNPERVRQLLSEGIVWEDILQMTPKQATEAPTQLMLTSEEQHIYQQQGSWAKLFHPNGLSNSVPVLFWFFALQAMAVVVLPITFIACQRLADRGYILSKLVGLLLVAWLVWFLASLQLAPFEQPTIIGMMVLLALVSGGIFYQHRNNIVSYFKENWRLILLEEALFWTLFGIFLLIRWRNPDLWHPYRGGEKPMDFAYLNAITKSVYFPPYDPWFANGYINYYYFGFVLTATLTKLTGIVPYVAYNLAVPTFFAMTGMGAFTVAFNLVEGQLPKQATNTPKDSAMEENEDKEHRTAKASNGLYDATLIGWMAVFFVLIVGNFGEAKIVFQGLQNLSTANVQEQIPDFIRQVPVVPDAMQALLKAGDGLNHVIADGQKMPFPREKWYWDATRVIPHPPDEAAPITEFPFFTFLFADLHAHMMALPYTLLVLSLVVQLVRDTTRPTNLTSDATQSPPAREGTQRETRGGGLFQAVAEFLWREGITLLLLGLVIGALWPLNTWDFPTYAVLTAAALTCRAYAQRQKIDDQLLWHVAWRWVLIMAVGYLLFKPFHDAYAGAYSSIELWKGSRTPLGAYLTVHGFFLFAIISYLISELMQGVGHNPVVRLLRFSLRHWKKAKRANHLRTLLVAPSSWMMLALELSRFLFLVSFLLILIGKGTFGLCIALITLTGLLLLSTQATPRRQLVLCFIGLGLALTLAVEIIVLKGDISRMNTVFKFYLQVWVLWGIATAYSLPTLASRLKTTWKRQAKPLEREEGEEATTPATPARRLPVVVPRFGWWVVFSLLFVATLLYPFLAINARVEDRFENSTRATLDGMDYMNTAVQSENNQTFSLIWDRRAIEWMHKSIEGSPVIVEATTPLYHWGSRVSIYTGLPTVVGWDWHQKQQRAILPPHIVDRRLNDVNTIFTTTDITTRLNLLQKYNVQYIYIGPLERIYYRFDLWNEFDKHVGTHWEQVYPETLEENPEVRIYKMIDNK